MPVFLPIRPAKFVVTTIPAVNEPTVIKAVGGPLWVCSTPDFDEATCFELAQERMITVPAGETWSFKSPWISGAEIQRISAEEARASTGIRSAVYSSTTGRLTITFTDGSFIETDDMRSSANANLPSRAHLLMPTGDPLPSGYKTVTTVQGANGASFDVITLKDGVVVTPPVDPAPVDPAPVDPTPVDPTPVDPTPVDPTPVDPTPVDPTPVDPTPVDPTPVDPTPVDPTPPPVEEIPNLVVTRNPTISGSAVEGGTLLGDVGAASSDWSYRYETRWVVGGQSLPGETDIAIITTGLAGASLQLAVDWFIGNTLITTAMSGPITIERSYADDPVFQITGGARQLTVISMTPVSMPAVVGGARTLTVSGV